MMTFEFQKAAALGGPDILCMLWHMY